jgi:2,3-bisphosphoglycerate-independent phosphoglycerate mutase
MAVRPLLIILLDGLGDRAVAEHGGLTANEAAFTPNLDALARDGSCGLLSPLGPGRAPSSERAHWSMLGYLPEEFPGRAVFEARGRGMVIGEWEIAAFAALRPAEWRGGQLWVSGRVGPADAADAAVLLSALGTVDDGRLRLALAPVGGGEAILRIAGGADDRVTDTDPFFRDRYPVLRPQALVPAAAATAGCVELWSRVAVRTLARHPVNRERAERGAPPLRVVTLKWWGRPRPAPAFRARHGVTGALIAASPFLAGLADAVGLAYEHCPETADPTADLRARLDLARVRLDAGDTFVFCHLKATDAAGHTKSPEIKRRTIALVDLALAGLADRFADAVVCVTGDHATPTTQAMIHSGDPVPFVVAGPGVRADLVDRFGELPCADGILGRLRGEDVMPVLLNAADRALFLGSRPAAVPAQTGAPAEVQPLIVEP